MPRLAEVDRLTGELLRGRRHSDRRYERARPGELLRVDVMKLAAFLTVAAGGCTAARPPAQGGANRLRLRARGHR
jgi:hypothetical protein